jgi:hypothetical protein
MFLRSSMFPSAGQRKATRALFNKYAIAGTAGAGITTLGQSISTLSGVMTGATLKTFLNVSGIGGEMPILSVRTNDATARTIRVKITVDGIAYDITSASLSSSGSGVVLAGPVNASNPLITPSIKWNSTFVVEIASSLTETDKLTIEWIYNTEA